MKYIKTFEDINIPIKIGDVVLGGKFKNRKIIIKKIGKNKKGDITVNDKPLLKYRIIKESIKEKDVEDFFLFLMDAGYTVFIKTNHISIYKVIPGGNRFNLENYIKIKWDDIKYDIIPFVETYSSDLHSISLTTSARNFAERKSYSPEDIINDIDLGELLKLTILLKKSFT